MGRVLIPDKLKSVPPTERLSASAERWIVVPPGGPGGPFWGVVSAPSGRVIAMQIPDKSLATTITNLPGLIRLRWEWASTINTLALTALDKDPGSNELDFAEEMADMVRPFLAGDEFLSRFEGAE